jgi:Zn-dependent protease
MLSLLLLAIGFLISLAVHEAMHAWTADRLGDPSARLAGRVTLNPLAHLDPLGTLLPVFLMLSGSPIVFGWGKPVPFDPYNLRHPRRDSAIISASGPAANIALATLLALILRLVYMTSPFRAVNLAAFFSPVIALNVTWAFFNLIPVHPLDGGKVLVGLLPRQTAVKVDEFLHRYGFFLVILLLFPIFGFSPAIALISPLIRLVLRLLLPGTPLV